MEGGNREREGRKFEKGGGLWRVNRVIRVRGVRRVRVRVWI